MKNTLTQIDGGKWAISKRKGTYLVNFVYDSKAEAEQAIMVKNVTDLHRRMESAYEKLVNAYPSEYSGICDVDGGGKSTLGDILA